MAEKPTYDELVQHIRALELNAADRLQAERQLRKSEQRYRRLFENAAFFISVFDENGRCLMMNQKMARLHGGHPEDYQGKSVEELYPESHAEFKRHLSQALARGQAKTFEERVQFPDGCRWLLWTVHPVFESDDAIRCCQVCGLDITPQKQAEAHLIQFKTAVEHSSDAVGISTPEGRHWYQNEAFSTLFGDVGEDPPATAYADKAIGREIFRTIMTGGHWTGEVQMIDKDGNILDILLRAYATKDENGKVMGLVGTQIC